MDDLAIAAFRQFNRFYTRQIGVLDQHHLGTPYSLTEGRVLFELAHAPTALSASTIARTLDLDAAYLSRILRNFESLGLIVKKPSAEDARQQDIELTENGLAAFGMLNDRSEQHVREVLSNLAPSAQRRLADAMLTIRRILGDKLPPSVCVLRGHRAGDMGTIVSRHGAVYAGEYGWDSSFEALVARIAADFLDQFDRSKDRCWIAEKDGQFSGCVMLVKHPEEPGTAKLRLLLVEQSARGLGLGTTLVQECIRFARQCGYQKITLWTNHILNSARKIYQSQGFQLTATWTHRDFGHDMVSETWELVL